MEEMNGFQTVQGNEQFVNEDILVFSLNDIGVSLEDVKKSILPTYSTLNWDYYDVLNRQYNFLRDRFPEEEEALLECYKKHITLHIKDGSLYYPFAERLSEEDRAIYQAFKPYRKRAISTFLATKSSNGWTVERQEMKQFNQGTEDYRSMPRIFDPMLTELTDSRLFCELNQGVLKLLEKQNPEIDQLELVCHQVEIVAYKNHPSTNSPEGIHQDGSDYIVSALVLERQGIEGGVSRIYMEDSKTPFFSYELNDGEGIFQIDANSPYFHDVSEIVVESNEIFGIRKIIGYDFNIIKK